MIVAIVGRPNVGKSTLFNRLTGARTAITTEIPGTTRDRIYGTATWNGKTFTLVDTAGIELAKKRKQGLSAHDQVLAAIGSADLILMVLDGSAPATSEDLDALKLIRKSGRPTIFAANKVDRKGGGLGELKLGSEPIPISAIHGTGSGDLLDVIASKVPAEAESTPTDDSVPKAAIVGRPNVGKSSLLNALLKSERVMVSDVPGTTRDAVETKLTSEAGEITLVDTAGIRRRGKVEQGIEKYSVMRSMAAIEDSDVTVLLVAADEGLTAQDTHIAGFSKEAGKGLLILVNKWDVRGDKSEGRFAKQLQAAFAFAPYALVHFVSAKTGEGIDSIPTLMMKIAANRRKRLSTGKLNRIIEQAVMHREPPSRKGRRPKIFYATQAEIAPPTFVIFARVGNGIHFSYIRYLENQIRAAEPFDGTAIVIKIRERKS